MLSWLFGEHFLFLITGTGAQLVDRPLLTLSLTTILTGIIILTTGFVCDFVLYHHARSNMTGIVAFALKDMQDDELVPEQVGENPRVRVS